MAVPFTITNDNVSIVVNGKTLTVRRGAMNFEAARNAVLNGLWDGIEKVFSTGHSIERWLGNGFTFRDGKLYFNDDAIEDALSTRIVKMAEEGADPSMWLRFWKRLQNNPSRRSMTQLYRFMQNRGIPIDEAGYILAYKSVQSNWLDFHSSTYENKVGAKHSMPRNKISDDPREACHEGFHVGSLEYARGFGGPDRRIVVCRVDPANVVCVPYDASSGKARVCEYHVIAEHDGSNKHMSSLFENVYPDDEPPAAVVTESPPAQQLPATIDDAPPAPVEPVMVPISVAELEAKSLKDLRAQAKIIGVRNINNILGGKVGLIQAIRGILGL